MAEMAVRYCVAGPCYVDRDPDGRITIGCYVDGVFAPDSDLGSAVYHDLWAAEQAIYRYLGGLLAVQWAED